ncbi:MAG TPA: hypothetical protein VLQ65_02855 [Saliniramus sp.]|nr:hypothetical protein [Saliniramus sp.]
MFFLLRTAAVIAIIYTYSPVHDDRGAYDHDDIAWNSQLPTDALAGLIDETAYENWSALPQYARDRLTMEIARQLADAAAMR